MIINAGIERVVEAGSYPDELARRLLDEGGITVEHFDLPEQKPQGRGQETDAPLPAD
jgi:deoxycytidylate deaminase